MTQHFITNNLNIINNLVNLLSFITNNFNVINNIISLMNFDRNNVNEQPLVI